MPSYASLPVIMPPAVRCPFIWCDLIMGCPEAGMLGKLILPTAVVVVVALPLAHSLLIAPYSRPPMNAGSCEFNSPGIYHYSNCDTATITSRSAVPEQ